MQFSYQLPAAIVGTAAIVVMYAQPLLAQNAERVGAIARQVTVRIDAGGQQAGSGAIIAAEGGTYYVLTAKHVVLGDRDYEIVTPDSKTYPFDAASAIWLPDVDLAIVAFTSSTRYTPVQLGNSDRLQLGTAIYVAGWPKLSGMPSLQFTPGQISGRERQSEGYELGYTNTTSEGMSGGPVLDENGYLVGIHGQAEGQEITNEQGQNLRVKPGFNWGIPFSAFIEKAPLAYAEAGREKLRNRDYAGAIADFNQGLTFNANSAEAYAGRGYAYYAQQKYREAIDDASKAIQFNSQLAVAYLLRGAAYARQGNHRQALNDFDRTIQLKSDFAEAYGQRALSRAELGDYRNANLDAAEAIRLAPDNPIAYIRRAQVRDLVGEIDAAREDLDYANTLSPPTQNGYQVALNEDTDVVRQGNPTATAPTPRPTLTPRPVPEPTPETVSPSPSSPTAVALQEAASFQAPSEVLAVAVSPDGQTIAVGDKEGTIQLWNRSNNTLIRTLTGHEAAVRALAFSPDGALLGSGSEDNTARMWEVRTGRLRYTWSEYEKPIYAVTFSQTGSTLIAGDGDGRIDLWSVSNGNLYKSFLKNFGAVFSLLVSPDGKTLVSGDKDGDLILWSLPEGDKLAEFNDVHESIIFALATGTDGRTLVSCDFFGQVKVWDWQNSNLTQRQEFTAGRSAFSVAVNANGNLLATGIGTDSDAGQIKLWNLNDGSAIDTISGYSRPVRAVTFTPDGRSLITGSEDSSIRIWQTP